MAKYSSKDLALTYNSQVMSNYIRSINGVEVEAILAESHAFGDTWFEALATGLKKMAPVVLEGYYDDTAVSGPDVIFGPSALGVAATLLIAWGGSKTTSVSAFVEKYERLPKLAEMTGFRVTLRPTSTVTEV